MSARPHKGKRHTTKDATLTLRQRRHDCAHESEVDTVRRACVACARCATLCVAALRVAHCAWHSFIHSFKCRTQHVRRVHAQCGTSSCTHGYAAVSSKLVCEHTLPLSSFALLCVVVVPPAVDVLVHGRRVLFLLCRVGLERTMVMKLSTGLMLLTFHFTDT